MNKIAVRAASLAGGVLVDARRASGGSLAEVMRVLLADGRALIAKQSPFARAEAEMLRTIAATGAPVPDLVGVDEDLLVMAAVPSNGRLGGAAWISLAEVLSRLHVTNVAPYGWPCDHAFGAVAIVNARTDDWPQFWAEHRLRCHVPHIDPTLARRVDRLADRLGAVLPARPRSVLLHGDLWGGNVLVADGHVSALIDPACYYGDREVDLAMLTLFDRPPADFWDALSLDGNWRDRLPAYRLWPLLVHLRLFGSGYEAQVSEELHRLDA